MLPYLLHPCSAHPDGLLLHSLRAAGALQYMHKPRNIYIYTHVYNMCVCVYTHTYISYIIYYNTYMHACMHTCIHICVYIYVCMNKTYVHVYLFYAFTYMRTSRCVHSVYAYVEVHLDAHVCMYGVQGISRNYAQKLRGEFQAPTPEIQESPSVFSRGWPEIEN